MGFQKKINLLYTKINNAVITSNIAIEHSTIFFIKLFFKKFLIPLPNKAHDDMHGKLIA